MRLVALDSRRPDPSVIEALTAILKDAQAGKITAFAIVGTTSDCTFSECKGPMSTSLIGEMALYMNELTTLVNQFRLGE